MNLYTLVFQENLKPGKFALVFKIKLYEFEQYLAAQDEFVLTGLVRYWNICGANVECNFSAA